MKKDTLTVSEINRRAAWVVRGIACAFLVAFAIVVAQPVEFATPASAGANESITIRKVTRIAEIHAVRGQSIVISTEVADQNDATGEDRSVNKGPEVNRQLTPAVLAQTVTIGGQQVSLDTLLKGIAKFYPIWRADDIAAAAAAAAAQNPP